MLLGRQDSARFEALLLSGKQPNQQEFSTPPQQTKTRRRRKKKKKDSTPKNKEGEKSPPKDMKKETPSKKKKQSKKKKAEQPQTKKQPQEIGKKKKKQTGKKKETVKKGKSKKTQQETGKKNSGKSKQKNTKKSTTKKASSSKKGKKKKSLQKRLRAFLAQKHSEDEVATAFGQDLIQDLRFKGKFSDFVVLSVDNYGKRFYQRVVNKNYSQKKAEKKEFFRLKQRLQSLVSKKPVHESRVLKSVGQAVVNKIRFQGEFDRFVQIVLDLYGRRLYKRKSRKKKKKVVEEEKKAPAPKPVENKSNVRKKSQTRRKLLRKKFDALMGTGTTKYADLAESLQKEIKNWSEEDAKYVSQLVAYQTFDAKFPVIFWNVRREMEEEKLVAFFGKFGACSVVRSPYYTEIVVNYEKQSDAEKCVAEGNSLPFETSHGKTTYLGCKYHDRWPHDKDMEQGETPI